MASTLSVPYAVLLDPGAVTESWDKDSGAQAVVKFRCLWDDRYQLVKDLVGTYTGTPPSTVIRVPPYRYPASTNLFCTAIDSIEQRGKPVIWTGIGLPWVTRKYAIVTARFSVPFWDFDGPDAYTKISFSSSGEFLTIPETSMTFSDGTPTNTPIGMLIPQMEITYERNRLPFPPVYAMATCQGRVNNAPFQVGGFPFNTGYLLFMSGKSDYQIDATGQIAYSQEYKFLARSVPWNWFLHPSGTGFQPVTDRSGAAPYDSADFTILP